MDFGLMLKNLWDSTGFMLDTDWRNYVMIILSFALLYLAIVKKFEPLLLVPISFGMLLANIPGAGSVLNAAPEGDAAGGLLYYLSLGLNNVIFPPLIFLGIGAMTDFGPMIANPKSLLIGAGAQIALFATFLGALLLGPLFELVGVQMNGALAASIAIIGGADGPTTIYVTTTLGQSDYMGAIAIAAYSYMALIPAIQKPVMRMLTTKNERCIRMKQLRVVSRREKIIFPIVVTVLCGILLPSALPLLGMLMFGNLLKETLVTERLAKTASNELCNIITIFLGLCVGFKASAATFLSPLTLGIVALGLMAFYLGTMGGIVTIKIMNLFSKEKINPLIGNAAVSAMPMAARVSHAMGIKEQPDNYLLMHAMGPNVAGVISSAVVAGIFIATFGA